MTEMLFWLHADIKTRCKLDIKYGHSASITCSGPRPKLHISDPAIVKLLGLQGSSSDAPLLVNATMCDPDPKTDLRFSVLEGTKIMVCKGTKVIFHQSSLVGITPNAELAEEIINAGDPCVLAAVGGSLVLVRDSSLTDNLGHTAVCAVGNAVLAIAKTRIVGNAGIGLEVAGNAKVQLRDTVIEKNSAPGVSAGEHAYVRITHSNITSNDAIYYGGGLTLMGDAVVVVEGRSIIANNTGIAGGGGVYVGDNATFSLTDFSSIATNSDEPGYGGGIYSEDNANIIISTGASVTGNSAVAGGGMYLVGNVSITISTGAVVTNNIAESHGGGVLCDSDTIHHPRITVKDASVSANQAGSGGGGFYIGSESSLVLTEGSVVSSNWANGSAGGGGILVIDQAQCNITGSSRVTGNIALKGPGGGLRALNSTRVAIGEGVFFSDNRAEQRGADLQASSLVNLTIDSTANINAWNTTVDWQRKNHCLPGEIQGTEGFCTLCVAPYFSFNPHNTSCDGCPEHATCGMNRVQPVQGYWASSNQSVQMHKCPQPKACLGESRCQEGYSGRLCGTCAPGYAFTGPFSCGICMSNAKILAGLFIAALVMLGLITYTVQSTWNNTRARATVSDASCDPGNRGKAKNGVAVAADLLKVLVIYVQYLVIIGSLRVEWPGVLSYIYIGAAWLFAVASSQVFSLDCLLVQHSTSSIPIPIQRLLVYLVMPLLMLFAAIVAQGVLYGLKRVAGMCCVGKKALGWHWGVTSQPASDGPQSSRFFLVASKLTVLLLVVFYYFYPSLVRVGFVMFSCYTLDIPAQGPYSQYATANATKGYWVYDMEQACWQGWHYNWALALGLPCLVLFCILVPPTMCLWLWSARKKLQNADFQRRFGFLYHSYTPKACYWEGVVCAQTMLLVCISIFSPPLGVYNSIVLLNATLIAIVILQLTVRPFAFRVVHVARLISTCCLLANVNLGLSSFTIDRSLSPMYLSITSTVILVANLCFVAWAVIMIVSYGRHLINRLVARAVAVVQRAFTRRQRVPKKQPAGAIELSAGNADDLRVSV